LTKPTNLRNYCNITTIKIRSESLHYTNAQYSLTLALEELGFPTLHTQHMYETQEILDMWTNEVFLPSINDGVVAKGSPDFDLIAQYGFQATTDLPAALYYEEIAKLYPDCKFVLTTRKNSEVWYRSWEIMTHSISQPARVGTFFNLSHVRKIGYYLRWLFSFVNKDTKYLSEPFPLSRQIKKKAIESYEEHNRRAREVIPSDKLLEYDVTQGYGPLCRFLNIAEASCPTKPLPQTNSARSVNIQAVASIIFPVIVLCLLLFSLFASVFYRLTGGEKVVPWLKNKKRSVLYHLLSKVEKKNS